MAVYNVYSAALRGIGDSKAPFYAVLLSSVVNIILDIVFVAYFHWGSFRGSHCDSDFAKCNDSVSCNIWC